MTKSTWSLSPTIFVCSLLFSLALGACQGNVNQTDDPSSCVPDCSGKECGADGCGGTCGICGPALGCTQQYQCESSFCGNGVIDSGEICEPGLPEDHEDRCPTECPDDGDACTIDTFYGTPETCDARCPRTPIIKCESGDGCCPAGCSPQADADCTGACDPNGTLDPDEACDPEISDSSASGYCPTMDAECDDGDECTADSVVGQPENCSAGCRSVDIDQCIDDDGCCPEDCDEDDDNDCGATCGDGVVTSGEETCDTDIANVADGGCPMDPMDCPDMTCMEKGVTGDPTMCQAECSYTEITACTDDDDCCPMGCTMADDNDCTGMCGDGTKDSNEACDNAIPAGDAGACPTMDSDCDDNDACTTDAISGMASDCTAECTNTDITMCIDGDGCCVPTCTTAMDDDCSTHCTDYCNKALANCTGANELYADMATCMTACEGIVVGDDPAATSGDTLFCRISHLDLAAGDPDTHCSHGGVTSGPCS